MKETYVIGIDYGTDSVRALLVVSEILPFVVLANRSKSTFYKILYHETKF